MDRNRSRHRARWHVMLSTLLLLPVSCGSTAESNPFQGERAYRYLKQQCDFGPREPGSIGYRQCLDFLESELRRATTRVHLQHFQSFLAVQRRTFSLTNIIVSFPPPENESRRVLFGAHWDTRPIADMDRTDPTQPVLGANDAASGVAVLLTLAHILAENPPPVGVDLIFFDGEDSGVSGDLTTYCRGSQYFARSLQHQRYELAAILDMVGSSIKRPVPVLR